MESFFSATF